MTDALRMQLARIAFDHDMEGAYTFESNEAHWIGAADAALDGVAGWLEEWADKRQALGWDGAASEVRRAARRLRGQEAEQRGAIAPPECEGHQQ